MKRLPVTVLVGGAALLWGLLLVVVWGIHPLGDEVEYAPVDNPSLAEEVSIDEVYDEFGGARPILSNRVACASTPLGVATGGGATPVPPPLPAGFEYVEAPCSSAYRAARAALWANAIAILAIVAVATAVHLRLAKHPDDSPSTGATTDRSTTATQVRDGS